jgi:hypothetical protein
MMVRDNLQIILEAFVLIENQFSAIFMELSDVQ